jgi:hypothetical protein
VEGHASADQWLKFEVSPLSSRHFVHVLYPAFTIHLVQQSGLMVPREVDETGKVKALPDVKVEVTVHNKWCDVTSDVLPTHSIRRTMVGGQLEISDWVFAEASSMNGGFFKLHIRSLEYGHEISDFTSQQFFVLSDKSHAKMKRMERILNPSKPKPARSRRTSAGSRAQLDQSP